MVLLKSNSHHVKGFYCFLDKTKGWHTPWTSKHKLNEINIMSLLNELKLLTTLNPDRAAKSYVSPIIYVAGALQLIWAQSGTRLLLLINKPF